MSRSMGATKGAKMSGMDELFMRGDSGDLKAISEIENLLNSGALDKEDVPQDLYMKLKLDQSSEGGTDEEDIFDESKVASMTQKSLLQGLSRVLITIRKESAKNQKQTQRQMEEIKEQIALNSVAIAEIKTVKDLVSSYRHMVESSECKNHPGGKRLLDILQVDEELLENNPFSEMIKIRKLKPQQREKVADLMLLKDILKPKKEITSKLIFCSHCKKPGHSEINCWAKAKLGK